MKRDSREDIIDALPLGTHTWTEGTMRITVKKHHQRPGSGRPCPCGVTHGQ